MRRTLASWLLLAVCATGVGYATASLTPNPPARGTDVVISTTDAPTEPVAHGGIR